MKLRKPSASAAWTSRYRTSSRRMTARTAAARAESPGPGGRCGVSRMCRSSFDTIPAMACSAAMATCSSGCCSGVAMSWSSETAPLRWQPAARTYSRKTRRRMIARIDALALGSARAVQALEMRLLDEIMECENRDLGKDRGDETRQRPEHERQAVGLQVANRVHRARDEPVGAARDRANCGFGIEEIVPVVGVAPQRARGPELRAQTDDDQQCTYRDCYYGRQRQVPGVAGREAEHHEGERVVIHDDRSRPPEASECFGTLAPLGGHAVPLPTPQCQSHKQHVRHSTQNGVREYRAQRSAHFRPNRRMVAAPRAGRSRLRYQKSTRRRIRTGPGRSIVRIQDT